jgi:rhodanese-related sulfurtransferase
MGLFDMLFGGGAAQVDPAQAHERLKGKPGALLIDVRQPEEFREVHIPGAKLIPLGELERRLNELPRNREIVVVCRSGSRSGSAARHLTQAGYQVSNLRGGMIAWIRQGLPVQRGR